MSSGALRRMMKMLNQGNTGNKVADLPPQTLEINPSHPIIVALSHASQGKGGEVDNTSSEEKRIIAKLVAEQMLDNALIAAGLIDDPRSMISRLNEILVASLK